MPRARPLVVLLLLSLSVGQAARGGELDAARTALYAAYAGRLEALAAWCAQQQLPAEAEQLTSWLPRREPDKLTLFLLPSAERAAEKPPADGQEWRRKWQALRDAQADALWSLARRAANEHRPSLALELATEAVRENPDHAQARKLLGFVRFRDAWRTRHEIRQLNSGKVFHATFGWLPASHVERYEKGQRYYQGRWMPAAEEAALRSDIKRGWRVESEHYLVTSNHSLEAGVALAGRLEMLYAVWRQVFAGFTASDAQLARVFEGRAMRRESKPHEVVYYRTREEYDRALRVHQPQIDITLGIYFDHARTAYFFAGGDQEPGTLYHEASHQLFHESQAVAPHVARHDNFWVVEGIACYMETLAEHGGTYCTLGGLNAGRVPAARHRLLTDHFYVPLEQLVALGMESLQRDPRISQLYSQSAGLAAFFMHAEEGRFREAFVRYLEAVYAGRATTRTLAETTGASYEALDRDYREFLSRGRTVQDATGEAAR